MTEKQVEQRLVNGVKALGGSAYKFVSPGNVGVPDRLVVMPGGRVFFVELKTDNGRLSKMQARQMERLMELRQQVECLHGRGDVDRFLKKLEALV